MEILNVLNTNREDVAKLVDRGVELKKLMEDYKSDFKEVSEEAKELGVPTAEFNLVVKTVFEATYDEQRQKIEELGEAIDILKE